MQNIVSVEEKEDVPKLRISLQLQHRRVCVPLQRPDVTNAGEREDIHVYKDIITHTQTLAHIYVHTHTHSPTDHLSREQLNTGISIQFMQALLMENV